MKINSALEMLNELISSGYEYPDAEYKVIQKFKLSNSQVEELVNLYDEQ